MAASVGSRVLVGIGAIVNDGAVIEDEVIVGAGLFGPAGQAARERLCLRWQPGEAVAADHGIRADVLSRIRRRTTCG